MIAMKIELLKLNELKEKGILTEDEFIIQKTRFLIDEGMRTANKGYMYYMQ